MHVGLAAVDKEDDVVALHRKSDFRWHGQLGWTRDFGRQCVKMIISSGLLLHFTVRCFSAFPILGKRIAVKANYNAS
ncbi:hypothetical protein Hypma_000447 [Hypsizygus marmoreus]|uniref:Uncharacterized protein n=1 Tax=Hypsizygus marmoreus TaxID=39966 RepID=A0A369JCN6_HYPMA|nr:hypothetical protein Hypma_000447 [Hypsizygus marmoreus]